MGRSMNWAWPPSRCGRNHHVTGNAGGHVRAEFDPDQMQAGVDAGGRPALVMILLSST